MINKCNAVYFFNLLWLLCITARIWGLNMFFLWFCVLTVSDFVLYYMYFLDVLCFMSPYCRATCEFDSIFFPRWVGREQQSLPHFHLNDRDHDYADDRDRHDRRSHGNHDHDMHILVVVISSSMSVTSHNRTR
jgi:hypothetical protein